MRKIKTKYLVGICLIMFMGLMASMVKVDRVKAAPSDYTVALTTFPATDVEHMAVQITGNIAVEYISLSNNSTSTLQTVSIYSECASTTTATLEHRVHLLGENNTLVLDWVGNFGTPFRLANPCFRSLTTASSVQLNIHYR